MLPEVVVADRDQLAVAFARRVEAVAETARQERSRFALGLPGGSVAEAFLPVLARAAVAWDACDLYWADERAVPPDHPHSNFGRAWALWLKDADLPERRLHRMPADAPDVEAAARDYERRLVADLGSPPALDVVLLGAGPDGHVCSLFPGHALLAERRRFVAPVLDSPKPPRRRLTFTLPALAAARLVAVGAFGETKAPAVRQALEDPSSRLPLALVLRAAPSALVLLDPAAAGSLRPAR